MGLGVRLGLAATAYSAVYAKIFTAHLFFSIGGQRPPSKPRYGRPAMATWKRLHTVTC